MTISFAYLFLTHAPPFYYCYIGFALFFWEQILEERTFLATFLLSTLKSVGPVKFLLRTVALFVGLELLVSCFPIFILWSLFEKDSVCSPLPSGCRILSQRDSFDSVGTIGIVACDPSLFVPH